LGGSSRDSRNRPLVHCDHPTARDNQGERAPPSYADKKARFFTGGNSIPTLAFSTRIEVMPGYPRPLFRSPCWLSMAVKNRVNPTKYDCSLAQPVTPGRRTDGG
jgi:hypothetical protein